MSPQQWDCIREYGDIYITNVFIPLCKVQAEKTVEYVIHHSDHTRLV